MVILLIRDRLLSDLKELGGIEIREMTFQMIQTVHEFTPEEGSSEILGILVEKRNHKPCIAVQKDTYFIRLQYPYRLGVNENFSASLPD